MSTLGRMMITPIAPLFIASLMEDTTRVNTFTGLVIGVSSAATTVSAVYLGRLGDRIGQRKILIVCTFIAALLYLPQRCLGMGILRKEHQLFLSRDFRRG